MWAERRALSEKRVGQATQIVIKTQWPEKEVKGKKITQEN